MHQFPTSPESRREDTVRVSWISVYAVAVLEGKKTLNYGNSQLTASLLFVRAREVLLLSQRCLAGHKVLRNGLHKRVLRA